MKLFFRRILILSIVYIVMIAFSSNCIAFPLPTFDIKRIAENVKKTSNQITEIKQEVESNLQIAREIQNGGYGAAAGDLFAKASNGDYGRFGENVKIVKASFKKKEAETLEKSQIEEENKAVAKKVAEEKAEEQLVKNEKAEAAAKEQTEKNLETKKKNIFNKILTDSNKTKAYNWLKTSTLLNKQK